MKLKDCDIREIENAVSNEKTPQYENHFMVIADNTEKTLVICAAHSNSTLKLGIQEAELLIQILQNQILEWK